MLVVPLRSNPSQTVAVVLNSQSCSLAIYQLDTGLFIDVYIDNNLIIGGVLCLNKNVIVRNVYLGFLGDLAFVDTQGDADPDYTGLASRYLLVYFTPEELAPTGVA